ncbi:hypothetical protein Psta_3937 [Pirellula staleyi DSM 6068]|uniref:DUF3352 domain-containing protein n=1 Tax=Pirellula staleyi (strain ATCC 27377 / DSM 6068 / ICPB 4128) TaxID=530564 RepID=D2R1Y0_PIRSD|nr:hypothetical protein [Pirellula staleyi]ADB18591.1 hypothetical protein Psta_3937 [Pirellula staleyi DSM 6068]
MAHSLLSIRWFSCLCLVLVTSAAVAAPPSESLLPSTTKGYISTQSVAEVREKFSNTQLGELVDDPVMKPFIDDLRVQISTKMERAGKKLGVKWDDLEGVYSGEVALALIQPDAADTKSHAIAMIADVTGKKTEVDELLKKIATNQAAAKATRSVKKIATGEIIVYTQPLEAGAKVAEQSFFYVTADMLILTDHLAVMEGIIGRLGGSAKDALDSVVAFQKTMARNQVLAGEMKQQIRWFVEPFGYAYASRAASGGKRKRGADMLKILQSQGFGAVQGIGGFVFLETGAEEILHRTHIYAPPVVRKAGDKNKDKYDLAMRMLNFPNSVETKPQPWASSDLASYLTFHMKMTEAFDYSSTLVDAIAGDVGVFEDMWKSMKVDPNGPMIDIKADLVNLLGTRVTMMSDVRIPIAIDSERILFAIEITKPATIEKTIQKAFETDPNAHRRVMKDAKGQEHIIWEIKNEEETALEAELMIEGAEFVAVEEEEEAEEPMLPNMAVAVFNNHLMIATHLDFLEETINNTVTPPATLDKDKDFVRIDEALTRLGSKEDSFRFYAQTSETYRPTYELLRQGKLPEAETMFARMLNGLLGSDEEGEVRKQEIDGAKLPGFDAIEKYLGPAGLYVQSEEDGWVVIGCLLKK